MYATVVSGKRSDKFTDRWHGPYVILGKVSPVTCVVDMPEKHKRHRIVHVEALKPWIEPSLPLLYLDISVESTLSNPDYHHGSPEAKPVFDTSLSLTHQESINALLAEFPSVATHKIGRTSLVTHKLVTTELLPIRQRSYPCPAARHDAVKAELQYLIDEGFIVPSDAPWAAPLFPVPQKNGQIRLVVDYRRLNNVTVPDPYVFPRIEDIVESMASSSFFSTLDLAKGYYQVLVDPESQDKTTFVSEFGKYKFRVMSFGLKNAPATFQRLMDVILKDTTNFCRWYIDDISVFSPSWDTHLTSSTHS